MSFGDVAPNEYCTAYTACAADNTARDKLGCTASAAMTTLLDCSLGFDTAGLCPNADIVLPGPATGTCTWTMDGATARDGYTLGLLGAANMVGPSAPACRPTFAVTAASSAAPGPTSAFLRLDVGGTSTASFGLLLNPQTMSMCPAPGLRCQ
jgi:hypothetical protein